MTKRIGVGRRRTLLLDNMRNRDIGSSKRKLKSEKFGKDSVSYEHKEGI